MKKIYITEKQLKSVMKLSETINQTIDKKPGESIDSAVKRAQMDVKKDAPNADVNFVIPNSEVNEDGVNNISDQVVEYIMNNWADDLDDLSTEESIKNSIQDAYIELTGMNIENDEIIDEIYKKLQKRYYGVNESYVVTKKQIKEAKKRKRLSEAVKIISKKDFINGLKK